MRGRNPLLRGRVYPRPMLERRCLFCLHWMMHGSDPNPEAAEREAQARYGPNVGLGGQYQHPTRTGPYGAASIATCELWEQAEPASDGAH